MSIDFVSSKERSSGEPMLAGDIVHVLIDEECYCGVVQPGFTDFSRPRLVTLEIGSGPMQADIDVRCDARKKITNEICNEWVSKGCEHHKKAEDIRWHFADECDHQ